VLVIVVTPPLGVAYRSDVAFAVINAPAVFGSFERRTDIPFGDGPRLKLDAYVPGGARRRPIIIFWYGGIWMKGAKEQYRFVGAALANAGYVTIVPDYRLFPEARFPEFVRDGARAVQWVHEHALELGGDPNTIILMGHSAGAHLAALLALDERYLRDVGGSRAWIRGWIGLSGPYALNHKRILVLRDIFREPYTEADWQPVRLVTRDSPPALIIQGKRDWMVSLREAVALDTALTTSGVRCELRLYDDTGHWGTVSGLSVVIRFRSRTLEDVTSFVGSLSRSP